MQYGGPDRCSWQRRDVIRAISYPYERHSAVPTATAKPDRNQCCCMDSSVQNWSSFQTSRCTIPARFPGHIVQAQLVRRLLPDFLGLTPRVRIVPGNVTDGTASSILVTPALVSSHRRIFPFGFSRQPVSECLRYVSRYSSVFVQLPPSFLYSYFVIVPSGSLPL